MITRMSILVIIFGFLTATLGQAQQHDIPDAYSNLSYDENGELYFQKDGNRYYQDNSGPTYSLNQLLGKAEGTTDGVSIDFGDFEGKITYGLIPYDQAPHPLPVFRFTRPLEDGKIDINIAEDFTYPYDFVGWSDNGRFTLGYRLANREGELVFDGEISVIGTGPFEIAPTLYEGPYVSIVTAESAVIWFETTEPVEAEIEVDGRTFTSDGEQTHHEIEITGLEPDQTYDYSLTYGEFEQNYHFETAHEKGSRETVCFCLHQRQSSRHRWR